MLGPNNACRRTQMHLFGYGLEPRRRTCVSTVSIAHPGFMTIRKKTATTAANAGTPSENQTRM